MGHCNRFGLDSRSNVSFATPDAAPDVAQSAVHQRISEHVPTDQEVQQELTRRGAAIVQLQSEVEWYKSWADSYWQQLQHMSVAAAALGQQQAMAVSQHQQQAAALGQYELHAQAAALVGRAASAALSPTGSATVTQAAYILAGSTAQLTPALPLTL